LGEGGWGACDCNHGKTHALQRGAHAAGQGVSTCMHRGTPGMRLQLGRLPHPGHRRATTPQSVTPDASVPCPPPTRPRVPPSALTTIPHSLTRPMHMAGLA
jgi:hypothetical protein